MRKLFYYLILVALPALYSGQTTKEFKVDSILKNYFPDGFNGNVLFASNDSIIFKKSYGYKDLKTKDPLNDTSIFELASCSKQFTALAILKLQELGQLSIYDSLRKFYPELPYYGVTIYHLLTHTSGLPRDYYDLIATNKSKYCSNSDVLKGLCKYKPKLKFKPGDKWDYSNTGYVLLASIIEKSSGLSFNDFLQVHFFKPLSMTNTRVYSTFYSKEEIINNYAYGFIKPFGRSDYFRRSDLINYRHWAKKLSYVVGPVGVNTSATDLVKWDKGLRNYEILSKESLRLAYDSVLLNSGKKFSYGFGYHLSADKEVGRVMKHTGRITGYQTLIYRLVDVNKILIILSNKVYRKDKITPAGNKIDRLLNGAYQNGG